MSKRVTVQTLPTCDAPGCNQQARYDAKSRYGPWGYFCPDHWRTETNQQLGTGFGQYLELPQEAEAQDG